MTPHDTSLCDQETMDRLAQLMRHGAAGDTLVALDEVLGRHPHDARIHLLRGSLHASENEADKARIDLREAVLLDPFLEEARFMLGYLEYTEGRIAEANAVWHPLLGGAADSPIRVLGGAMLSLLDADLSSAREALEVALSFGPSDAIASYIQRLLADMGSTSPGGEPSSDASTAAHFLISDYVSNQTKH